MMRQIQTNSSKDIPATSTANLLSVLAARKSWFLRISILGLVILPVFSVLHAQKVKKYIFKSVSVAQIKLPPNPTPVIRTLDGYIKGTRWQKSYVFRGIPYSAPRTGSARFMAPVPHSAWSDTLDCLEYRSESAQPGSGESPLRGSEDGLFLNVYTPSLSRKAKMPVLVWVHGGSMVSGSGNGMNGNAFSDRDSIVTITLNYRLGVFGFMYMGDIGAQYKTSGNNGLLDVIQALKWIRANIARFGGDPSRVTVMGESAGAKLSSALIAAPEAEGLYAGIILESGGFQCIRDSVTAKKIRSRVMEKLGITDPRALLKLSTQKLMQAEAEVLGGAQGTNYFGPVMDGRVIRGNPYQYVKKQGRSMVHYLIGANENESKIFMDMDKRLYHPDQRVIYDWFGINYPYCLSDLTAARQGLIPGSAADSLAIAGVLSQYMYQMHAGRMADTLSAAGRAVWMYRFKYPPAHHASELRYVWYDPIKDHMNAADQAFAKVVHQYWVQFIRNGRPGIVQNINWGAYSHVNQNIMILDTNYCLQKFKKLFNNPNQPSACFLLK